MEKYEPGSIQELTGGMVETEFLGTQELGWNKDIFLDARRSGDKAAADKVVRDWLVEHQLMDASDRKQPYGEPLKKILIQYFQENPGWDPSDPQTDESTLANDLHALIADKLVEKGLAQEYGELKFYRTADSPLDTLFGIDGFFEFNGNIITIDVTKNESKLAHKADKIIQANQLFDPQNIELVADDIALSFSRPTIRLAS